MHYFLLGTIRTAEQLIISKQQRRKISSKHSTLTLAHAPPNRCRHRAHPVHPAMPSDKLRRRQACKWRHPARWEPEMEVASTPPGPTGQQTLSWPQHRPVRKATATTMRPPRHILPPPSPRPRRNAWGASCWLPVSSTNSWPIKCTNRKTSKN
jgi:hypothetical protein